MSHRCRHGNLIIDDWTECSACCAEHDAAETADAVRASLEEQRKQTALLERMAAKPQNNSFTVKGRVVTCPNVMCGQLVTWQLEEAGHKASCPYCKSLFWLPELIKPNR